MRWNHGKVSINAGKIGALRGAQGGGCLPVAQPWGEMQAG